MAELPRQSPDYGPHDRVAECNALANRCIAEAIEAAIDGSPVKARELLETGAAALHAASLARQSLVGFTYRVIDGERWYRLDG